MGGRIVGGVAAGIAARFNVSIALIRLLFLTMMCVSPFGILLYVLLWLSMPSEGVLIDRLQVLHSAQAPRLRFEEFVKLSSSGILGGAKTQSALLRGVVAILMLLIAIGMQVAYARGIGGDVQPAAFAWIGLYLSRFAIPVFYLVLAAIPFFGRREQSPSLILVSQRASRFSADHSETRALFGVASGFGMLTGIDPVVIRVILVLLNIFSFGLVTVAYLITAFILDQRGRKVKNTSESATNSASDSTVTDDLSEVKTKPVISKTYTRLLSSLFVVLAATRFATEFRLFFFNESYVNGLVLGLTGLLLSYNGLLNGSNSSRWRLGLLAGTAIFLYGCYDLSIAFFNVQMPFASYYQIGFAIFGVSLIYFAVSLLQEESRTVTLGIAVLLLLPSIVARSKPELFDYAISFGRFYSFFCPLLYAGCALWVLFERRPSGVFGLVRSSPQN
jgi:phage shock protein PspC (stress-responsive transcriptional regulator)